MNSPLALNQATQPTETLRQWLSDKPFDWGTALTTRSALRILPWCINQGSDTWIERYTLPILHSLFIAWSTVTNPIKGHKFSAELSAGLLYQAAMFHEREAYFASAMRNVSNAISTSQKAEKIDHCVRATAALANLIEGRSDSDAPRDVLWQSLDDDVFLLGDATPTKNSAVRKLMHSRLVDPVMESFWRTHFDACLDRLSTFDSSYRVWVDWLTKAVAGGHFNFFSKDDGPDFATRDRQVSKLILDERTARFWSRPASAINFEIEKWIVAAGRGDIVDSGDLAAVPPQNENAISFQANNDGKIELSKAAHYDALRNDADTQDRYDECVSMANSLLDRCEGSNSAIRLTQMLKNYLEAAGSNVTSIRPSLFVQRGERLRQELAAYQNHDTLLPPIPDDNRNEGWTEAHPSRFSCPAVQDPQRPC